MTQKTVNARDITVEVETAVTDTWVEVLGLTSVKVNKSENEETAETTTFASDGAYEGEVMQRGASLELEGLLHKDDTTGTQDTGQLRCETLADAVGAASLGRLRFRHPNDTNWTIWTAYFSGPESGGGNNAKSSWSCKATRSGASTTAAVV